MGKKSLDDSNSSYESSDEKSSTEEEIEETVEDEEFINNDDVDDESMLDDDDVDDAMVRAHLEDENQDLQKNAVQRQLQFEKQHVILTPCLSGKVKAVVFTKRYFEVASLTEAGKKLLKDNFGK